MTPIAIKIQSVKDAEVERMALPFLKDKHVVNAPQLHIAIMEDMTATHQSAVSLVMQYEDGKYITANISESQFKNLASVFEGAMQRFKDEKGS